MASSEWRVGGVCVETTETEGELKYEEVRVHLFASLICCIECVKLKNDANVSSKEVSAREQQ